MPSAPKTGHLISCHGPSRRDLASGASAGGPFTGHGGGVLALAVAELGGRPIVISGGYRAVRVWDLASSSVLTGSFEHNSSAATRTAAVAADRTLLIRAENDRGQPPAPDISEQPYQPGPEIISNEHHAVSLPAPDTTHV